MTTEEFEKAAATAEELTKILTEQELLDLYGLYTQAKEGDCNTPNPGFFAFTEKYKWDSWNKHKGKSKEEAQKLYIDFVKGLKLKHSSLKYNGAR